MGYISSKFYKIVSVLHLCSSIRHVFWALVKAFNCRFYKNRKNKAEYGNIWTGKPKVLKDETGKFCLAWVSCVVNMLKIVSNWSNLGYISSEFYKLVSVLYLCSSIRHAFLALVKAFNCRFYQRREKIKSSATIFEQVNQNSYDIFSK